jgi:hypothetical protein
MDALCAKCFAVAMYIGFDGFCPPLSEFSSHPLVAAAIFRVSFIDLEI